MRITDAKIKEIVQSVDALGYSQGRENVYRDWCELFALALANGCDLIQGERWQKREKRYRDIIGRYKDAGRFAEMSAALTEAFEADPFHDYLGQVYMECFGGNKNLGQCFTPEGVCAVCASVAGDIPKNGEHKTFYEPACGSGAMTIAFLKRCYDAGYNYQRYLHITTEDLDSLCVHMCFIQLSLLGARAVVWHKNTITQQVFDKFVTPAEMLQPALILEGAEEARAIIEDNPWLK